MITTRENLLLRQYVLRCSGHGLALDLGFTKYITSLVIQCNAKPKDVHVTSSTLVVQGSQEQQVKFQDQILKQISGHFCRFREA